MTLTSDIISALTESQDINLHLKPLRNHFDDLEQCDFDMSEKLLAPMFHCLCLVWSNSKYYNTAGRVVVMLTEMCNMMIEFVSVSLLTASATVPSSTTHTRCY